MQNNKEKKLIIKCNDFISVNHYMSYRVVKRGSFHTVMPYKPAKTKNFEKEFGTYIKKELKEQGWIKPSKNKFIIMDTIFYFPRVDMDAQNYFKSLCDIMTEQGVWEDDNKVLERVNRIYYDSKNPRIEIEIYEADHVGIFDTEEEYEAFKSNCMKCKRFKRNCSIYKKVLESRIQEDIVRNKENDKWTCLKFNS